MWWGACVYPRIYPDGVRYGQPWHKRGTIPAPTLAEILIKLPTVIDYCGAKFFLCMHDRRNGEQHDWQIGYEYASGGGVITSPFIQRDIHPATAALKLWLDAVLRNSNQSDTTDIASNKTQDAGRSDVEEK